MPPPAPLLLQSSLSAAGGGRRTKPGRQTAATGSLFLARAIRDEKILVLRRGTARPPVTPRGLDEQRQPMWRDGSPTYGLLRHPDVWDGSRGRREGFGRLMSPTRGDGGGLPSGLRCGYSSVGLVSQGRRRGSAGVCSMCQLEVHVAYPREIPAFGWWSKPAMETHVRRSLREGIAEVTLRTSFR